MKIANLASLAIIPLLFGCAAKQMGSTPQAQKILYTTDGKREVPEWVYERPFFEKEDRVFVSGVVDIDGNQNPSRGLTAADLQARAELSKAIQTRLSAKLQFANEGFGYDEQLLHQIVSMASDLSSLTNIRIEKRGYAQLLLDQGSYKQTRYSCYSLASVPRSDLQRMIANAIRQSEQGGKISPSFRKKIDREWDRFFDDSSAQKEASNLQTTDTDSKSEAQ
ncbi:MAG: hypothetical protein COV44_11835 [Deltaproteobacteria bacterium CG11_big_fil_rev_8_21_14_0_20_45_16]|nr:MAG: hypothetical protein COV44_11835 [Deltaproteobacteria bacterium CG11_big_fil_rev_8_21_14_0_20_45_16]